MEILPGISFYFDFADDKTKDLTCFGLGLVLVFFPRVGMALFHFLELVGACDFSKGWFFCIDCPVSLIFGKDGCLL